MRAGSRAQSRGGGIPRGKVQAITNGVGNSTLSFGQTKGTKLPLIGSNGATMNSIFSAEESQPAAPTNQSTQSWASSSRHVGFSVGVCSQQGKRPYQEDEYSIRQFLSRPESNSDSAPETHFFGLFDGHAGGRCSQHVANSLATALADDESFTSNLPQAVKRAFHAVNEHFLKVAEKMKLHDGSTGLVAIIRDSKILVANVGDCRALVISNGRAIQMSTDHKPTNIDEQKRISSLGGTVVNCMGVARVNRVLAVSRAFGNRTLRTVIRPDAELTQRDLVEGDDFLVLASDGLWDVLKNKDVSDVCYSPYLQRKAQVIAEELVQMALARGSMDNVTCVVVNLADYRAKEDAAEAAHAAAPAPKKFNYTATYEHESKTEVYEQNNMTTPKQFKKMMENALSNSAFSQSAAISQQAEEDSSNNNNGGYQLSYKRYGKQTSNNNLQHDIPSRQYSLGQLNPNDMPTGNNDSDLRRGLKTPLTKATSTGSLLDSGSSNNLGGGVASTYPPNYLENALRPLTAVEAFSASAPLPRGGNNSGNGGNSSKTVTEVLGQQKAAFPSHIRSMRNNLSSLNHNNNNNNNNNNNGEAKGNNDLNVTINQYNHK